MPQRGHFPGTFDRTSLSMGQTNSTSGSSGGVIGCCHHIKDVTDKTIARNMTAIPIIARPGADKPPVETVYKAGKYLTFRVARQDFAMNIAFVRGILPVHQMTTTDAREFVCGFAVIGGRDFAVIDLQAKLGIAPGTHGREPFIIVVQMGESLAGFIADRVSEVLDLRARDFRNGALRTRGRVRRVLDPSEIMTAEDRPAVRSIVRA
jgi:chemotaxis signal transduction protein